MKLLQRAQINDTKWNNCVNDAVNGLIYANTWYLDVVAKKWCGLVWEEDGKYTAVFPLPFNKKIGFTYVYPPFFIQQLGLFTSDPNVRAQLPDIVDFIGRTFKFVELYLNNNLSVAEVKQNSILPLRGSMQPELNYSSNHKRNIKKAHRENLSLVHEITVHEIIRLFKQNRGSTISTLKQDDYKNFEKLCKIVSENAAQFVVGVEKEGELVAGAVFFQFKNRITFIFSGNTILGKNTAAMFYLLNEVIQRYKGQNIVIDFEGSQNKNLNKFYQGFGAQSEKYSFLTINNLPWPIKQLKKG